MDELEMYKRLLAAVQKENEKLEQKVKELEGYKEQSVRTFEQERKKQSIKFERIITQFEKDIAQLKIDRADIERPYKRQITTLRNKLSAAEAYAKWKYQEVSHHGSNDKRQILIGDSV